jgi:hypothetical protein
VVGRGVVGAFAGEVAAAWHGSVWAAVPGAPACSSLSGGRRGGAFLYHTGGG